MRVPVAAASAVDLDEADVFLGQAARHQAEAAELSGNLLIDAVELLRGLAFLIEIGNAQRFHLHAGGEFVVRDTRFEILIEHVRAALLDAVQIFHHAEEALLLIEAHAVGAFDVVDGRLRIGAHAGAVEDGRQPGGRVRAVADGRALAERDVTGHVLVFRAERVIDPRSDGREAGEAAAGDEGELRGGMVDAIGRHGADERDFVDHLLEVRQQVGDRAAALAVLLEFPGARHDLLGAVQGAAFDFERRGLAVVLEQSRLGIEHVDGAGAAADVDEDHALGFGREHRRLRQQVITAFARAGGFGGEETIALQHGIERHGAEADRGILQSLSASPDSSHG